MEKLSFVIPCYGSETTIEIVVNEIRETLKQRPEYDYEIILVNDCSPDRVWPRIRALALADSHITGIDLAKNFGQHAALMAGYRHCTGDLIISLDDDGQTPACELFTLVDKMKEGWDVVYASYAHKMHSGFRNFGTWMNERMTESLIGKPKGLRVTSYFIMRRFIADEILRYENAYPYIEGLIFRATRNIANVPVTHHERMVGESGYTFSKLLALWFNGFTAFSVKPLRIATFCGSACACIGFLYGIYVVIRKLVDSSIEMGWSSIIASIFFLGGLILIMLGMIGEYIGRIYISINNAPQYTIRQVVTADSSCDKPMF
ncbi:glycosyltransferase [Laedolimicola intestinihominis]|uniref:Glycosyltransferase family 2 protein n=1 Tax=Laedolimicola intestinihominis TaxID=3133166 RepID=A0ABV1FBZ7_9FIRM|nr:glycosyltransferase [Lachnospiraceae bacterium]